MSIETTDRENGEQIPTQVASNPSQISKEVADRIAELITERAAEGKQAVLGLATGSTPVGVYSELVRLHRDEGLSFQNVVTFNLDEYFPMLPDELQSYVRFMREHLFDHIDIDPANVHIPDGTLAVEQVPDYCRQYELKIEEAGGIDIQLLGIGRTGHIGFNEPGSGRSTLTRLITLDRVTRVDAASDFFGAEHVPRRAITMGVGTVLGAREVIMIAFGEGKSQIVAKAIEGPITPAIPATFLQEHPNARVYLDEAAAAALTRSRSPWLTGAVEWEPSIVRKAVIWLAGEVEKAILKLTDEDYNEHGLQSLLAEHGPAYDINLRVFRSLQETISGWPGGKRPDARQPGDRRRRFEDIYPKRALIFSPHPDDDVISMGGTLIRLADQGHEVHVAYQTSGNIAVFDDDVIRFADFVGDLCRTFEVDAHRVAALESHVEEFLRNKQPGQVDSAEIQKVKGLIRRSEAKAATRYCGVPEERLHFLDLPFYETGRVKKKPLGPEDLSITVDLLRGIEPHQIYAAGDLSDPHGTHRTCLAAVLRACEEVKGDEWFQQCEVWLYRGAWQEWAPHEIEMAVPLSPDEVERKRVAIFKHESQKDKALFPGPDRREFWQRAEQRNAETAQTFDRLGLAEFEAIEGFVRWKGDVI
ncbi:glucosamine-6-phosphate deaminase [Stratiformator vulcanicus]